MTNPNKNQFDPAYRLYYVYLESLGINSPRLTSSEIALVLERILDDYKLRFIDLGDLSVIAGHLFYDLVSLPEEEQDKHLKEKLIQVQDIDYSILQYIKTKQWDKISQNFKEVFSKSND